MTKVQMCDDVEQHILYDRKLKYHSDIPNRVANSETDIQLVLQLVIKYLTLFHIVTMSIFSQIKKVNLVLILLVLRHILLPHLFHTPKFPYGSHLYLGVIQIETFCLKSLEKLTEGKKHLFGTL